MTADLDRLRRRVFRQVVEKVPLESRGQGSGNELANGGIVGQRGGEPINFSISLFSGGHCLITGAPWAYAKTLWSARSTQRLSPPISTNPVHPRPLYRPTSPAPRSWRKPATAASRMQFVKGPIFANVGLADEINRTLPKTQAALLEAMQEHQVTAAGVRYPLEEPFFVLATQNPVEMEGTYPLPEAQLDRFMFNVVVDYLPEDDEVAVVKQTTSRRTEKVEPLFDGNDVLKFHDIVRKVPIAEDPRSPRVVRIAAASRPGPQAPGFINDWVSWGAGLRAGQSLVLGAKARALLAGRFHATPDDVRALVHPTLRHRILLGYRAEADGVTVDTVIDRLLEHVKGRSQLDRP